MNKKTTTLILIFSIISTIVTIVVLVLFFRIIENKNIHTNAVLSTLEKKMEEKENIEMLKERIIEIEETRNKVSKYLLNPEFIDTFVSYLEEIGTSVNTEMSVTGIESLKNEKNTMQIKINSKGFFSNVMKSIALVENMPFNVDIVQIYLNKDLSSKEDDKVPDSVYFWVADITFNIKSSN